MISHELNVISDLVGIKKEYLIAPFFIFISALIGATVALWGISSNRKISRLKNSMEFINRYNDDITISKQESIVRELSKETTHDVSRLAKDEKINSDEAKSIRHVLNYYESMAICINNGIYDSSIIKEALYSTVTDNWSYCEPYVLERRRLKEKNTFFQETELLVKTWHKHPLKRKCHKFWHLCKYWKTNKAE